MTNKITKLMLNGDEYEIREYQEGWQPGANTLAYFPLEQDVNDYSGNNNNASGGPNSFTDNGYGLNVASYSGNSTTLPTTLINSNPRTVLCWINDNGVGTGSSHRSVFGQHTSQNYGFTLMYNSIFSGDNAVVLYVSGGTGWATEYSVSYKVATLNGWHLVVCMRDQTKAYLYIDGVYRGETTYSGQTSSNTFYLGYDHGYDGGAWSGKISKLIFEDKIRTETEIQDYYNQTKSLYGIS